MARANIKVCILEALTLGRGKMIYSMGKELRNGKMEANMKEYFNLVKRMVLAGSSGLMVLSTMVSGFII
jgi:hypothetical protein